MQPSSSIVQPSALRLGWVGLGLGLTVKMGHAWVRAWVAGGVDILMGLWDCMHLLEILIFKTISLKSHSQFTVAQSFHCYTVEHDIPVG